MEHLLILNLVLIAVIAIGLLCVKKYCKSERIKDVLLIVSAIFTVFCHYSSLLYHHFSDGTAMEYLTHNPNLILPIYPCNVVLRGLWLFERQKLSDWKIFIRLHFLVWHCVHPCGNVRQR